MVLLTRALRLCAAVALFAGLLFSVRPAAQRLDAGEQALKAAFLYNFTKFIDWPEAAFQDPSAPFTVCALADDGFKRELHAALAGEQVRGREVLVITPADQEDVRACHMAYFSPAYTDRAAPYLAAVAQLPVLTVGDGRRFLDRGGLIAFFLEHGRVRFVVRRTAADRAGLHISSKLLRVARDVE